VLPTLPFLAARLKAEVNRWDVPVAIVTSPEDREDAFATSVAAVTSMGTSTLELALAGVPMVGTYVADTAQVARFFKYRARYTCLPNIVLNRLLVPEVLFDVPDARELAATVARTLETARIERQLAGFREMRGLMEQGTVGDGLADAADRVQAFWRVPIGT
jgi:lipid-A-disaccharide synthase